MIVTLTCSVCGESWQADVQAGSSSPCRNPACLGRRGERPKRVKVTRAMVEAAQPGAAQPGEPGQAEPGPDNGARLASVDAATGPLHPGAAGHGPADPLGRLRRYPLRGRGTAGTCRHRRRANPAP